MVRSFFSMPLRASACAGKVFLVQVRRRFPLGASRTAIETPSRLFNDSPQGPGLEGHRRSAYTFFANDYQAQTWGLVSIGTYPSKPPRFRVGSLTAHLSILTTLRRASLVILSH